VIQFDVEFPMFLNVSSSHKGSVDKADFELLHKFLPLGENTHPTFKDWLSEEEKKSLNEKSAAAKSSSSSKKKKKKKKSAAKADSDGAEEDGLPIDVLCEDISAELFNRMKDSGSRGSHNARSHQHATEDDDDENESGGQQCRVQ
jgi:hypothetical protein